MVWWRVRIRRAWSGATVRVGGAGSFGVVVAGYQDDVRMTPTSANYHIGVSKVINRWSTC